MRLTCQQFPAAARNSFSVIAKGQGRMIPEIAKLGLPLWSAQLRLPFAAVFGKKRQQVTDTIAAQRIND